MAQHGSTADAFTFRQPLKKTTRFSLENLPCRPVKLTLRTAPYFLVTLHIPAQKRWLGASWRMRATLRR